MARLIIILTIISQQIFAQEIRTYGIKINVTDLEKARKFYGNTLGFGLKSETARYIELDSRDIIKLFLYKVPLLLPESKNETKVAFTLQVNDIDASIQTLKGKGVDFGDEQKRKEGVGYAIYIKDPFETAISLMHQTVGDQSPFEEPRIYNFGVLVPDMDRAITFYSEMLGFVQRSNRYLPLDMPLGHADKSFGFMLHYRIGTEPTRHNTSSNEHVVILFQTDNLDKAIGMLKEKGVQFLEKKPVETELGRHISFYDPFGYLSELYEVKN